MRKLIGERFIDGYRDQKRLVDAALASEDGSFLLSKEAQQGVATTQSWRYRMGLRFYELLNEELILTAMIKLRCEAVFLQQKWLEEAAIAYEAAFRTVSRVQKK